MRINKKKKTFTCKIEEKKIFRFSLTLIMVISLVATAIAINTIEPTQGKIANQTWVINDVKACPYNTSEYVKNIFDCSNMAHMLYDWLSKRGHICYVMCIENNTYGIKHCFLYVDGYAVEPTTKDWAWWYYEKRFKIDKRIYVKPCWMYGKEWKYPKRW